MPSVLEAIVLGLGGMGSSTLYHLAKKGIPALGIEQFEKAHSLGSSHGKSRLIRKAYFEHSNYVPLLERSYSLWDEIAKRSGRPLFHPTGLILYGSPTKSTVLSGVRSSAKLHSIPIEELSPAVCAQRFPRLVVPEGFVGIYEPTGGYLEVENCVKAYCEEAERLGAELHFRERVIRWGKKGNAIQVVTDRQSYLTRKLLITAGPWSQDFLGELSVPLTVRRVPMYWFRCGTGFTEEEGMPSFAFDLPSGFIYGFPALRGEGIKIAPHLPGAEVSDPTHLDRNFLESELGPVAQCIRSYLPGVETVPVQSAVCMYTLTPDSHFVIDQLPAFEGVFFAAGFSGHGFKFSSVVGEILSDLSTSGKTDQPIDFLRIRR